MLKLRGYFTILGLLGLALVVMALGEGWEPFPEQAYGPRMGAPYRHSMDVRRAALAGPELWVLTEGEQLWSVNEETRSAQREPIPGQVLDLCIRDGVPTLITASSASPTQWTIHTRDGAGWRDGPTLPSGGQGLVTLLCEEQALLVVTSRRLIRLEADGTVFSRQLSLRVPAATENTVLEIGDQVLVGTNQGEFGGGVHRIDRKSGSVSLVERTPARGSCEGLLDTACDPVAGVTLIPWKPECAAILVRSVYFSDNNAVLEVCGGSVEHLYLSPCAETRRTSTALCMSTGLAVVDDRLLLTGTHEPVWLDQNGGARTGPLPAFQKVGPFDIRFEPTMIMIDRSTRPEVDPIIIRRPLDAS